MAYGLYGDSYPKIVAGVTTYNLDLAKVLRDEPQWFYIIHQSGLNQERTIKRKGALWVVELEYNLFDCGSSIYDLTNAFIDLCYDNTSFYYYRHSDGQPYKDSGGSSVNFKLSKVIPFYKTTSDYKDALYMQIISTKYVKIAPTES